MRNTAILITELQSYGVRVKETKNARRGGAGPADGITLLIKHLPVNVAVRGTYVSASPYSLTKTKGVCMLHKGGEALFPVEGVPHPRFYDYKTEEGIPFSKIALLHGRDCLSTTVIQKCIHWDSGRPCKFCTIEVSLMNGATIERKTPMQLAEVARAARDLDHVRHVTLTTGTERSIKATVRHLSLCVRAVKEATDLPIHVQLAPPSDESVLSELKDAGVDTIGIHVESFDPACLSEISPAKSKYGMSRFEKAWQKSVELFGRNQVSTFLIAGLGESRESIIKGAEYLAAIGVYPFLLPLRPLFGSALQDTAPPEADYMIELYEEVSRILEEYHLSARHSKAGCVRCGACSALPAYEAAPSVIIKQASTEEELREVFEIRKEVFVDELRLFKETDIDELDRKSSYLIAVVDDHIVGTVRAYPSENDVWFGSRIAVRKDYRRHSAAEGLTLACVDFVKRMQCKRFIAHIFEAAVPFFESLGWRSLRSEEYCGVSHRLMEASLTGQNRTGWR